jgi:hypothetical protein
LENTNALDLIHQYHLNTVYVMIKPNVQARLLSLDIILQIGRQMLSDPVSSNSPSEQLLTSAILKIAPIIGSASKYFPTSDVVKSDDEDVLKSALQHDESELLGWIETLSEEDEKELVEYLTYHVEQEGAHEQVPPKKGGAAPPRVLLRNQYFKCHFVDVGVGKCQKMYMFFVYNTKFVE